MNPLAKWRKSELVMACLSFTVNRGTQQGTCSRVGEITTLRSTHELKHKNLRDTN